MNIEEEFDQHKNTKKIIDQRMSSDRKRVLPTSRTKPIKPKEQKTQVLVDGFAEIEISKLIENPYQPRKQMDNDKLYELADSIKKEGLLQPITVSDNENGTYTIVFGHRRAKAHALIKHTKIKAIIEQNDDKSLRTKALIENIQQEKMSPTDLALSFSSSLQSGAFKNQTELAAAISKDKVFVSKMLKILTLPEEVLEHLVKNESIKDTVVIDMIRLIKDEDDCKTIYFWYIENSPNRDELKNKIKSLQRDALKEPLYTIKPTARGVSLTLPKLDKEKMKELERVIKNFLGAE